MTSKFLNALSEVQTLPVITLGEVVEKLEEEALLILTLLSILPFLQPIPLPGLSSVLGLVVLLQGIALIFWKKPILTDKMRRVVISPIRYDQIYKAALKFEKYASKISVLKHPLSNSRGARAICGMAIVFSAAILSLPLPIPFSNTVPALSIAFICVGLLEEDVILILCGLGITCTVIWMSLFSYHIIVEILQKWI